MDQSFTEDEKILLAFRRAQKLARRNKGDATASTSNATTGTSVTAAFARSFVLLLGELGYPLVAKCMLRDFNFHHFHRIGVYFKRPSRLWRPTRVDTLTTLRQMALAANQSLSPSFIRALVKDKGPRAILQSILPPLLINTALGTLLFTSHSYFCYLISRLDFFAPKPLLHPGLAINELEDQSLLKQWTALTKRGETLTSIPSSDSLSVGPSEGDGEDEAGPVWLSFGAEDQISFMESIHRLPHPTLLSALAGAGAGAIQGVAFAPIENAVKLLQRGITSWSEAFSRVFGLSMSTSPFRPIRSLGLPTSPQEVKQFFGFGQGIRKAWKGVRFAMVRDALGYALFFSTFDVSRRVGLAVKAWLTPEDTVVLMDPARTGLAGRRGEVVDEYGLHPTAPTSARLAQAACLVTGGISASFLAEFVTRPIRRIEDLAKIKENRAPGLEFKAKPTRIRGIVRPFQGSVLPLIKGTFEKEGLNGFFRNPTELHTPLSDKASSMRPVRGLERIKLRLTRFGWRLIGVGPWGVGFVMFAYLGGEV